MADAATADLVFLPWVRRGAAAALVQPDTLGAQQPAVAVAEVGLTINSGAAGVRVPVRLMGPGHVTGLDARQIVRTDRTLDDSHLGDAWCAMSRRPHSYETSWPGLFALGDLRSGSTKRVAAAVGEGSAAIRSVHEHLSLTVDR